MGRLRDFAQAKGTEAVSWAYHRFPASRNFIAKNITKLTGERDLHLRWRIGKVVTGALVTGGDNVDSFWVSCRGAGRPNDPGSWRDVAIGTNDDLFRPAVIYPIGRYMMIGTQDDEFIGRTDAWGTPNAEGDYVTTVVRAGPGKSRFVLANAHQDGRRAVPVPTDVMDYPTAVPEGLHRV